MRRQIVPFPVILCGMLMLVPVGLSGQAAAPARPAVPDRVLYEGFLRNLALIVEKANDLDRSGGNGSGLKEAVCARVGLGNGDCTRLMQTAANVGAQLTLLDKRAQSIIDEVRRKHKERAAGSVLPPPPPELAHLQTQRNSLVGVAAATLRLELTSTGSNALTKYLAGRQEAITPTSPN